MVSRSWPTRHRMWAEGVIPIGKDAVPLQADQRVRCSGHSQTDLIVGAIQVGHTPQASGRFGGANELEHGFITHEGLPGPVVANGTEQAIPVLEPGTIRAQSSSISRRWAASVGQ